MTRIEAAKLYEFFLKNAVRGYTLEDAFDLYYNEKEAERDENGKEKPIDAVKRKKEFDDFKGLIEEARKHGQTGNEVVNYLKAPRDTIDIVKLDDNGNVELAERIEGDPVFDPSGKIDLTPLTGTPDFNFGDESVKLPVYSESKEPSISDKPWYTLDPNEAPKPVTSEDQLNPRNVPVFDDSETNDFKIVKPGEKEDIDFPNSNPNNSDDEFGQGGPGGLGL